MACFRIAFQAYFCRWMLKKGRLCNGIRWSIETGVTAKWLICIQFTDHRLCVTLSSSIGLWNNRISEIVLFCHTSFTRFDSFHFNWLIWTTYSILDCGTPNQEIRIVGGRPTGINVSHLVNKMDVSNITNSISRLSSSNTHGSLGSCTMAIFTVEHPSYLLITLLQLRIVFAGKTSPVWVTVTIGHLGEHTEFISHNFRLRRSKIRIILGDHDQFITSESQAKMRAVSAIIRHRNFDSNTYNHDIALLKLRKTVVFTKTIRPVCLPSSEADPAGIFNCAIEYYTNDSYWILVFELQAKPVLLLVGEGRARAELFQVMRAHLNYLPSCPLIIILFC